jgi:hypothetical protein
MQRAARSFALSKATANLAGDVLPVRPASTHADGTRPSAERGNSVSANPGRPTLSETITASDYRRMNASPSAIVRRMKKKSSEAQLQKAVVTYLKLREALGQLRYFAVPNAGKRSKIAGAILKRQGLVVGVPDLVVVTSAPSRTIFLELKSAAGKLSKPQQEWRDYFTANKIPFFVVKSLDDLKAALA